MDVVTFDDLNDPASGPVATAAPPAASTVPSVALPGVVTFDDLMTSPTGPAPLTVPGPANAPSPPSTDPTVNPDGDGLTQDQIDASLKARFAKAGAQGRQNLADLPENAAHTVAAVGGAVPLFGAGVNRAAAALATPFTNSDYAGNLDEANRMDAQFDAQHPAVSGVAKATGATVGTIGMLPEAGLGLGTGSLLTRAGTAALAQGALSGTDAALRGQNPVSGAVAGVVGGAAGPAIGAGAGAAYRVGNSLMQAAPAELKGMSPIARSWLTDSVAGMSPADYAAAKEAVGPAGMFAEASPRTLDYAKSIADQNGPGKATVRNAFQSRMDARNDRVSSLVNTNFGPVTDPTAFKAATQDQIDQLGTARAAMLSKAGPVDISPVVDQLQAAQGRYAPNSQERGAISKAVNLIGETKPPEIPELSPVIGQTPEAVPGGYQPISDATQLHNAKQNLDKSINYNSSPMADPNATIGFAEGAYKDARGGINDALRAHVDGYGENQDAQASLFAQNRALDDGLGDLTVNNDPARYPPTFAQTFGALSPAQQDARRAGQRFAIEASLGNKENDFQATRSLLQGDGGWNAANLGTSFGPDAVNATAKGLRQEVQMARNSNHVVGGSPTNENQQIRRLTSPEGMSNLATGIANYGDQFAWGKPVSWLPPALQPRAAYNRMMEGAAERSRTEMAPYLVKSGPEADDLFRVLTIQAQRRAALSPPNTDPLVRALAAARQVAQQRAMDQ